MDPVVEALKLYIGEHMAYFIVLLVAIIALACWLTTRYVNMKNKISSIDELPCKHHGDKLDAHDSQFSDTRAMLSRMEAQLEILVGNSIEKSNNKVRNKSGWQFSAKHSPRRLNENGEALLKDCGGEMFLREHLDYFIDKIRRLKPKTPLDVEDYALAVLQISTKEDMFIPLKNWVYNAPTREIKGRDGSTTMSDVEMDDILFVLSLPLRDRYLELYNIPS